MLFSFFKKMLIDAYSITITITECPSSFLKMRKDTNSKMCNLSNRSLIENTLSLKTFHYLASTLTSWRPSEGAVFSEVVDESTCQPSQGRIHEPGFWFRCCSSMFFFLSSSTLNDQVFSGKPDLVLPNSCLDRQNGHLSYSWSSVNLWGCSENTCICCIILHLENFIHPSFRPPLKCSVHE